MKIMNNLQPTPRSNIGTTTHTCTSIILHILFYISLLPFCFSLLFSTLSLPSLSPSLSQGVPDQTTGVTFNYLSLFEIAITLQKKFPYFNLLKCLKLLKLRQPWKILKLPFCFTVYFKQSIYSLY